MRRDEVRVGQLVWAVYGYRPTVYILGVVERFTPAGRVSVRRLEPWPGVFDAGGCSALLPANLIPCEMVGTAWGRMPLGV